MWVSNPSRAAATAFAFEGAMLVASLAAEAKHTEEEA